MSDIDADTIPEADFLRQLKVRLCSQEKLESITTKSGEHVTSPAEFNLTTRPWTDSIAISLVLDTPTSVITLPDETLHVRGIDTPTDLEDLWRIGYRNLWQELVDATISVNEIRGEDPGASFFAVESDSFFLASAALFLEDFLPHWAPELSTSEGVLLALPNRHLLLLRAVTGGTDLLEGINSITSATVTQYVDTLGPISPQLHLVREGTDVLPFTNIGHNDAGERVVEVHPDDFLMDRLNEGREPNDPE